MAGVRLLVLAAAVAAIAASANAAQVRKLRGWQVTHITMATTMSDQLTNPQLEVCDNGEERVLAVTTVNKIDAHPTRMHWWAIYFPSVHRVLPYGAPGMRTKATNKTTVTWGYPVDTGDTCTVQTKTCTRNRPLAQVLLYKADPYPVARGLVWVWWQRWHSVMWAVNLCIPPGIPTNHLYHDLPRDGGSVRYGYARRECRDCGLDPLTRTRYAMWFRAAKFHFRMAGSGALAQRSGFSAMKGTYSYRLDTAVRQIFN